MAALLGESERIIVGEKQATTMRNAPVSFFYYEKKKKPVSRIPTFGHENGWSAENPLGEATNHNSEERQK